MDDKLKNTMGCYRNQTSLMIVAIFGISEMIAGLSAIILKDFTAIFEPLVAVAGSLGAISLMLCVINAKDVKVYDLLASALLFAYGTGTLVTLVSSWMDGTNILTSASVTESWLSLTLGLVIVCAGSLHLTGVFDRGGYIFPSKPMVGVEARHVLYISGSIALLVFIFVATGKLGFMANLSASEGSAQISASAAIVLDLIAPMGGLSLWVARRRSLDRYAYFGYLLAFFLLLVQFGLGRRIFVFSLISYLAVFFLARPPKVLFSFRNLFVVLILALFTQTASTAFYCLRMATNNLKDHAQSPTSKIFDLVPEAIDVYQNRERYKLFEKLSSNVSSRSFILGHLALLTQRISVYGPLYGENIARAVVMATPSVLYPSKFSNPLFGAEEDLAHPHLRMATTDAANSILTGGLIDLGTAGFFIYPLFICMIFSMLLRVSKKMSPPVIQMIIAVLVFKLLLSVEADFDGYVVAVRAMISFMFGGAFLHQAWLVMQRSVSSNGQYSSTTPRTSL